MSIRKNHTTTIKNPHCLFSPDNIDRDVAVFGTLAGGIERIFLLFAGKFITAAKRVRKELLLQRLPDLIDDVIYKNHHKSAEKNEISNTVKIQTAQRIFSTSNEAEKNRRRLKRSRLKPSEGITKRKAVLSKRRQPKRSRSDFFAKVKEDR